MKKSSELTACSLLVSLLLLSACSSDPGTPSAGSDGTDAAAEPTQTEYTAPVSGVPDTLDLSGKTIRVLNAPQYDTEAYLLNTREETGETIGDAVYRRNLAVENNLHASISYIDLITDKKTYIRKSMMAADSEFDCLIGKQSDVAPLAMEDLFLDLSSAPYIDIKTPWWSENFIENANIGDKTRFFITGDVALTYTRDMGCVFYNKRLYADYYDDGDGLYKTVLDGKWTLDQLLSLTKDVYTDLDGDGQVSNGDLISYRLSTWLDADHLYYDAGAHTCISGADGLPVLDVDNPLSVNIAEKLYTVHYENPSALTYGSNDAESDRIPEHFAAEHSMFMFGLLYYSDYLRDMDAAYGIIPYPKYDESQDGYRTLIHDGVQLACIPTTTADFDGACAVLEELAYQGYEITTPAYYEIALKNKYVRDSSDTAMRLLDMIRDSSFTEVGYVYNFGIDGAALLIRNLMQTKQSNLTTLWAEKRSAAEVKFSELLDTFLALENH